MSLNRRLLIGIAPVLLIFLGVSFYAIFLFTKLGGAIDVILRENYQSVVASQNMKEALGKMNAGLLLILAGEEEKGGALFQQYAPVFAKNLDIETHNITLPGEGDLATQIKQLYDKYLSSSHRFFAPGMDTSSRRALYLDQLLPETQEIEVTANRIMEINQQNMVDANSAARAQSRDASRYMLITILIAFIVAAAVAYALARSLIQPLKSLTESARQLGEGNLDQHVPVQTHDEMGLLAEAFNKLGTRLRAYRQSTTEKIVQAQQRTESALRAFPDPIFVFSTEMEIQLQNSAADKLLSEIRGDWNSLGPVSSYIKQSLRGTADFLPTSFDKAIPVAIAGSERFFLPRTLAMRDGAGDPIGVVLILQDVTRFRVADDLKTDLIATVSHELKTPLTSVQMAVYLLLEEKVGPLNPKQIELLIAARSNSDRLFEMIEDLLDLARFEGGAALIEKKAVSSELLVEAVASRETEFVAARGRELKLIVAQHLPSVEVSQARIDQVFANFISNAVKYSPQGSTITISAKREGANHVRFGVKDEGAGVPKDMRRRIFDKFFRIAESGDVGAGLGLSIAREIVLAHGGNIGVDSNEGHGSEFFFILPAVV